MEYTRVILRCSGVDLEATDEPSDIYDLLPEGAHFWAIDGQHRLQAILGLRNVVDETLDLIELLEVKAEPFRCLGVELELVNTSNVAAIAKISREAVRLWVTGKRGPGNFPDPFTVLGGGQRVWILRTVNDWLRAQGLPHDEEDALSLVDFAEITRSLRPNKYWRTSSAAIAMNWETSREVSSHLPLMDPPGLHWQAGLVDA